MLPKMYRRDVRLRYRHHYVRIHGIKSIYSWGVR